MASSLQPLSKDGFAFPSLSALPPRSSAAIAAVEQRRTSAASSYSSNYYRDISSSETIMGAGNSPPPRETQNPLDRWQQPRSESSSTYHSPYTASYPHTSSGLRPAEPGQFSAEPWSARGEPSSSSSSRTTAPMGLAPGVDVGPVQQPPMLRPIKRPSSPDYWATQPSSRQRSLASPPGGTWTSQVAIPQPGQIVRASDV